jgi:hypothetical protein
MSACSDRQNENVQMSYVVQWRSTSASPIPKIRFTTLRKRKKERK